MKTHLNYHNHNPVDQNKISKDIEINNLLPLRVHYSILFDYKI